jgi:hypothetical protein
MIVFYLFFNCILDIDLNKYILLKKELIMKKIKDKITIGQYPKLHPSIIRKVDDFYQISNQFKIYFKEAIKRGIL